MSRTFCRNNCKQKNREHRIKYKEIRARISSITDENNIDYKTSLENPLNILILLYLYKRHSSLVYNNSYLLQLAQQFEEDNNLNIDKLDLDDKGVIRMIWLWQMAHNSLYCDLCGNKIIYQKDLTLDHKIPKSHGGKVTFENSRPTHKKCNNLKGSILPEEWEKIGKEILSNYAIPITLNNCGYNYR